VLVVVALNHNILGVTTGNLIEPFFALSLVFLKDGLVNFFLGYFFRKIFDRWFFGNYI
jgi:hypothetical protein